MRLLHRHRPLIVAVLAGLAVLAVINQLTTARDTVTVLAANEDLALGDELSPDLVHPVELPVGLEPRGALTRLPADARLTGPVRAGETLTDVRVSESGLPPAPPGTVIVPVPLSADASRWLRPGQDVLLYPGLSTDPLADGTKEASPIRATVLAEAGKADESPMGGDVRVVTFLVTVTQGEARSLASASDASSLVPVLVS